MIKKKKKNTHLQCKKTGFDPWVEKIPWRREWLPPLVFLPGEFHGQSSLAGYSPKGCRESDTSEQLTLSLSFSFINDRWKYFILPNSHSVLPLPRVLKCLPEIPACWWHEVPCHRTQQALLLKWSCSQEVPCFSSSFHLLMG